MRKPYLFKGIALVMAFLFNFTLKSQDPVTYEAAFPNLQFEFPVELVTPGDNSNRFFVVEQPGQIKVFTIDENTTTQSTFLDVRNLTLFSTGQEMGLLGLAFHPNYENNRYFYIYQTMEDPTTGWIDITLARYRTRATNPNVANPNSRQELIRITKNQRNRNHNGGKIGFGPDGYLYMSVGDGGGGGDPQGNAQNLNNIFGSILRIDVDLNGDNPVSANGRYEIPSDNPRVGQSGLDELYAWGIRNTWKFSWDLPTGRMWAADVGQRAREEVNLIEKGGNYGWNRHEGNIFYDNTVTLTTTPDIKPIYDYDRSNNDVSVTGGFVYRGASSNTSLQGKYIFGDYVSGRVFSLDYNAATGEATRETLFRTNGEFISSFALDDDGELYFSGYGSEAQIFKIVGGNNTGGGITEIDGIGSWEEFQQGTNGIIEAVLIDGNKTFIAGEFTNAGGTSVSNIALYEEGQGWTNLDGGANGKVNTLDIDGSGNVYAGGDFDNIGGVAAKNIAMWNGSQWSALGNGVDGTVAKLGVNSNNELFVGGAFVTASGVTVNNIALWNGSWNALTDQGTFVSGTNNEIRAIAFDSNDNLYIGGNFDDAGGKTANRIAVYDGTNWSTLGDGTSGFVQEIIAEDDYIYAGGNFAIAGSTNVSRVARWDRNNSTWEALGGGVSGNVNDMVLLSDYLYVAGSFETASTSDNKTYRVNNVARWSPSFDWQALGTAKTVGTDNRINALAVSGESIIAGGNFLVAGRDDADYLAIWNPMPAVPDLGIEDGAVYEMESTYTQGLGDRLTVRNSDPSNSNVLDGELRTGGPEQQFRFISQGGDLFKIESILAPGKFLDVAGQSTANNAEIHIYQNTNNDNQVWKAIPIENGLFRFEPQHAPGKRLDIEIVNGVPRALSRNLDNGNSQRWRLYPVDIVTQIGSSKINNELKIYPNPSESGVYQLSETADFKIYGLSGSLIQEGRGNTVDLSSAIKGVYFLQINNSIFKLVK